MPRDEITLYDITDNMSDLSIVIDTGSNDLFYIDNITNIKTPLSITVTLYLYLNGQQQINYITWELFKDNISQGLTNSLTITNGCVIRFELTYTKGSTFKKTSQNIVIPEYDTTNEPVIRLNKSSIIFEELGDRTNKTITLEVWYKGLNIIDNSLVTNEQFIVGGVNLSTTKTQTITTLDIGKTVKFTCNINGKFYESEEIQVVEVKRGITGNYIDYMFKNLSGQPTDTPDNGTGWTDLPTTPPPGEFTWMSTLEKDSSGNLIGTWSTPTRLSGERAPNLLVEYSLDGETLWHSEFNVNTDLYMRTSNDNGLTWSPLARIVGEKGDQGVQGDPLVTYYIVPDKHTVVYDPNNLTFDGQSSVSIQIKLYKRVGNNLSVLQNVYWKMNDTNYNDPWTLSNSINIVVNQAFYNQYGNSINIKAYLNSTDTDPIDIQTINILDSLSETYILLLDNELAVLLLDLAGTVSNYTTLNHKPSLYRGAELITDSTLEITLLSGGTFKVNTTTLSVGSTVLSSGLTITLSNMTQDNLYITYKHNPSGITKTFKLSKSKQGIQGEQGEPLVRKYIVLDLNMFVYNPNTERFSDGTSSKTVTLKLYQKVGNLAEQLIPVYWKIGSGVIDTTLTTTKSITINSVVGNTTVLAYQDSLGTILIDQQTISVISSLDDLYNIVMTNEFDTVLFDLDNNLIDPRTSITTNVYLYKGTTQKTLIIAEQSGGTFTLSGNTLSLDANSIQADTLYCIVKIVEFPSVTKRFTVKKVKNGKEAQYIEFRYKNALSKPSLPTVFNPTDWSLTPSLPLAGQFTWVTQLTKYKNSFVNSWSEPVKYTYPSLLISVTNISGRQTVYNGSTFTPTNVTFTPKLMQDNILFNTGTFYIYNLNGTQLATVTSGSLVNILHSLIFSTDDRYNIYNEKSLLLKITFNGVEYISNLIVEMKNTQYNWLSLWNNTTVIGNENIATGKLFVGQNVSGNLSGVYIGNTKDIGGTVYDPGIVLLKDNTERFKVNVDSNKDVNVHIGDSSNYLNYSTSNSTLEIKGKLRLVSGQTPSFPLPEGLIAYWTDTLIDDIGGVTPEGYGRPLLDPILEVDGDAIINGTLTADKVDTNNFFTKNFVVKTGGTIVSEGHESFSSTTPGFWLGKDTSDNKYKFFVGDINNLKYLQFNGDSTHLAGDLFGQFVGDAYLYNTEFIKDTDNETGEIVYDLQLQQIYRFPTTGLELLKTFGTSTQYILSLQNILIQPLNEYLPQTGTSGVSLFTVKTTESLEITTSAANTPYYRIEVRVYKYFPLNYFKGQSAGEKYYQTLIFDFTDVILYGLYTLSTNKLQISFSKSNRSVTVLLLNESSATIKTITKKLKSDITKIDYRTFLLIKKTANTVVNGMSYTFTTRDSGHLLVQIQADPDLEGETLNLFNKSTVVNSVYGIVKLRTFDGVATLVYLADVLEKIWCDEELELGIPIQIRKGKLVKAVNPFKKVWITSTNPGVILGSKRENLVLIALTGSTYVNCILELDDEICLSVNGKLKVATLFDKLIGKYIIGKVIQKEDNKSLILLY